jgi:hypothetical protein
MRRAVFALMLLAGVPSIALAAGPQGPIDAIAMIDYKRSPQFKVGDWVRYRTRGESAQGFKTDYTVTVLIAGEEFWWGEKCFWVETQTAAAPGQPPLIAASLLSYDVFKDPKANLRFRRYVRKYVDGVDGSGRPDVKLFLRAPSELTTRGFEEKDTGRQIDTVGVGTVQAPKGTFEALRVNHRNREFETNQEGDSTIYFELLESHAYWFSNKVPITSLVRMDQENTQRRRAWMIGESENAPLRIVEHTLGGSELIDFGSGMKALAVPERLQHPLSEQRPAGAKKAPARRPAGRRS